MSDAGPPKRQMIGGKLDNLFADFGTADVRLYFPRQLRAIAVAAAFPFTATSK